MKIDEIRIYSEVLEQGLDFKDYFLKAKINAPIKTVYAKKGRNSSNEDDSFVTRLRNSKDVDVLITFVSNKKEYPVLMVEYSTAVPTDDHKMQRSDVYYWGSVFNVPELKIYPKSKGMNQQFGGGDRFNDEQEQMIAYRKGTILWPVLWHTISETIDVLETKENCLSCIHYSPEIYKYIEFVVTCFNKAIDFLDLHRIEMQLFKKQNPEIFEKYGEDNLHTMIVDSSRFKWEIEDKKLVVKINRFGHAMDPDRGVLFFINMLVGFDSTVTEIQVNRPSDIDARGGYRSLFDSTSAEEELIQYVRGIIQNKNNVFDDDDAIHVFRKALNIPDNIIPFNKVADHEYFIDDLDLISFFGTYPSITTKSLFFLSSELRLTDKNRNIICRIKWNYLPVNLFLSSLTTENFTPLKLKELSNSDMKEDIITFASVELYKKLDFGLLAVSYPGAQGDRAILTGSGRNVKRTYVDIIAYSIKNGQYIVYLEECKDNLSKSEQDIKKLKDIIGSTEKMDGLRELFKKTIQHNNFGKVYTSLGGALTNLKQSQEVDYIFMFNIDTSKSNNSIDYTIAIVDLNLVDVFRPLANSKNRLEGSIVLNGVYVIE